MIVDLAADAHLARQAHPDGERSTIAPPATVYAGGQRAARRGADPRLISTAFLDWAGPRPRELWLDIDRPGWGTGEVAVTLNRHGLEPLRLRPGRHGYAVRLPAHAQQPGRNRLRLTFRGAGDGTPPPPAGGRPRLGSVSFRRGESAGAAPSVSVRDDAGSQVLSQAAGTRLEYALRLPEAGELRFTPRLREGESALFRVELTVEGEPSRELFRREVWKGRGPGEAQVALPDQTGRPALLVLAVDSGAGVEGVVGDWVAPGVRGRPEIEDDRGRRESGPALEDLRLRLREAGVLLIVLDAAAAGHFGCYGYERDTTPEIDRLATEGVVFDRAYSPASYTTLAMSSLWTVQHPEQHHHGRRPAGPLPESRVTLPELLAERGIPAIEFVGNPNAGRLAGLTRGFRETRPLGLSSKSGSSSSIDEIEMAIVARPGPGLTYLHYLEPHFPYNPPPPFDSRFGTGEHLPPDASVDPSWFHQVNLGRVHPSTDEMAHLVRLYDGNLAAVDHEIGRLRRRLEEAGRWDDLLVILTADHGEAFLQHGLLTHAAQVFEESVRIPLIVRLPGETWASREAMPVDLIDLGATLAVVFGVGSAGDLEGRSLLPLLAGETLAPRVIVSRTASERPTYGLVDGTLKLIHDPRFGATELYDLGADPGETEDLSPRRPVTTELLRQFLYRWLRDLDRGTPDGGAEAALSAEDEEALRALGYVH